MIRALLIASIIALSGCSTLDRAQKGIAADVGSTGIAFMRDGVREVGAGVPGVIVRLAINEHAKTLPDHERVPLQQVISAGGWAGFANNVMVAAGAGPVALVIGAAVGVVLWVRGENEREFYRQCAVHRELAGKHLECNFVEAAA